MPVEDPTLRLAINMYHNKGAYALLLGSGVSRSAGIFTGWQSEINVTFRCALGAPGSRAQQAIDARKSKAVIDIVDADSFFLTLEEHVTAIQDIVNRADLTAEVASVTLKRFLSDPYAGRIRAHDLITRQIAEGLLTIVAATSASPDLNADPFPDMFSPTESIWSAAVALFGTGCRWGGEYQIDVWAKSLAKTFESTQRKHSGCIHRS